MSDFVTFISLRGASHHSVVGTLVHLMTQGGRLRLADVLSAEDRAPQGNREYGVEPGGEWVSIVCPEPFETLALDLSRLLGCQVFLFHLHDGDTWLYWFYKSGHELDRFDALPGYWEDSTGDELKATQGNVRLLAQELGLDAQTLAPYLARTTNETDDRPDDYDEVDRALELLDSDARVQPDDRFDLWDARVMYDFMRRLGITPPLEPNGKPAQPLTILRFETNA